LAALPAVGKTEIGDLNGAKFRIDVPDPWNGSLVMFCHGYSAAPVTYADPNVHKLLTPFLEQGYAVAQSAYAATGWAIEEALHDTEALRLYFIRKYGEPKETWISGGSMGGFLTVAMMERYPTVYDGGLALCGPMAPASEFIERRGFDLRVVFDHYFPDVLPPLDRIPADFNTGPEQVKKLAALLDAKPRESEAVRRYGRLDKNVELAWALILFTHIIKDVQQRGGGNPFDNRNTIYEGTSDDKDLNDRVKRYQADPRAAQYLRNHYTPTGRIGNPLVAIHTIYDPLVPVWLTNEYSSTTQQAGTADLFVQQYVRRTTHCGILPEEVSQSFQALREWKKTGKKAPSGVLEVNNKR
jgi:pimeloyl-ACP methyl ester carboxylesterase